jgi:hypothetical protein
MVNQPHMVACQNRGSADLFPKGCSLPFEIGFPASGDFVRKLDGFIHAAGRGREESRDGLDADTGAVRTEASSVAFGAKALPNSALPCFLTSAIQSCPGAG